MRNFLVCRVCFLIEVIATVSLAAGAQTLNTQHPKQAALCVNFDSNYARITAFLPSLSKSLIKDITRQYKQVHIIALGSEPRDAVSAAEAKGCDYLLQLSVLESSGVGSGYDTRTTADPVSPEEARQRRELDWVQIEYRLQALSGRKLYVTDSDHIRYLEYPSAWDSSAFETTVSRATRRVALASLENLPKN